MKIILIVSIAISSLLLLACSSGEKISNPLINDIWALNFIKGVDYKPGADSNQRPVIEINSKENHVTGNTGCNTLNGKVVVEENQIEFSDMVTTKMFCEKSIEAEFLESLGMVNNFKIEKLQLSLYRDDELLLIFQKID